MCTIAGITWLATRDSSHAKDNRDIEEARDEAMRTSFFSDAAAEVSEQKRKKKGGLFSDSWSV